MRGFKFAKVLVGENLVKDVIGIPRRAAADEFTISRTKRIENGIIQILVISYKVKLIPYTTSNVGPLIVSGLLGKASMLLPLTK
jgi:hypothetical protein